jgi:uroporphyrinogen decarboxylase
VAVIAADARFLRACRSLPTDRVPVWFMRQAGRSLPEYRARRGSGNVLDAARTPELAAELTLQPVRRLEVDAAILFSDIMVPVAALGVQVDLVPGRGPVVDPPFRGPADLGRLRPLEAEVDVPYVAEAVRILSGELDVPLIGFAGGPFTVASYLIEGGASRTYARTKTLMRTDGSSWRRLLDALADVSLEFLRAQVEAGASAVQVFDSWAGTLSADDYLHHVLPSSRRIFEGLSHLGVPRIHFGTNVQGELLSLMAAAGADVLGVDWRVTIADARRRAGPGRAVQGNLDPTACLAPWGAVAAEVRKVLAQNEGKPGHVFNLGHGVLPETDPDVLRRIVDLVHEETDAADSPPAASHEVGGGSPPGGRG